MGDEGRYFPGRTDPSASRAARPHPAPTPRRAPPRPDPPVVCPGFGIRQILDSTNLAGRITLEFVHNRYNPKRLQSPDIPRAAERKSTEVGTGWGQAGQEELGRSGARRGEARWPERDGGGANRRGVVRAKCFSISTRKGTKNNCPGRFPGRSNPKPGHTTGGSEWRGAWRWGKAGRGGAGRDASVSARLRDNRPSGPPKHRRQLP